VNLKINTRYPFHKVNFIAFTLSCQAKNEKIFSRRQIIYLGIPKYSCASGLLFGAGAI